MRAILLGAVVGLVLAAILENATSTPTTKNQAHGPGKPQNGGSPAKEQHSGARSPSPPKQGARSPSPPKQGARSPSPPKHRETPPPQHPPHQHGETKTTTHTESPKRGGANSPKSPKNQPHPQHASPNHPHSNVAASPTNAAASGDHHAKAHAPVVHSSQPKTPHTSPVQQSQVHAEVPTVEHLELSHVKPVPSVVADKTRMEADDETAETREMDDDSAAVSKQQAAINLNKKDDDEDDSSESNEPSSESNVPVRH